MSYQYKKVTAPFQKKSTSLLTKTAAERSIAKEFKDLFPGHEFGILYLHYERCVAYIGSVINSLVGREICRVVKKIST